MLHALGWSKASGMFGRLLRLAAASVYVWALVASSACAAGTTARSLITLPQIINAMQDRQLPTRGVQVKLAAPITTSATSPALEIQGIVPITSQALRLRIACHDHSECLPFFAIAIYPEAVDLEAFQIESDRQHAPIAPTAERSVAEIPSSASKLVNSAAAPMIRTGSPATLDFDGDRVHVRLEVICLESGRTGDKIRVTTRDHKQIYTAEIVTSRTLKGTLTR